MQVAIPLDQPELYIPLEWKESQYPYHVIEVSFDVEPSAGSLSLFAKEHSDSVELDPILGVARRPLNRGYIRAVQAGKLRELCLRFEGVVGGSGAILRITSYIHWPNPMHPDGVFTGFRAMTTQGYTEGNVKRGSQFEASSLVSSLAAGGTRDTVFITGDLPVIVKSRQVSFNGVSLSADVFRGPSYTGGTPVVPYNLNDINPKSTTVSIVAAPTISDPGVQFGATTYMTGSAGVGNTNLGTFFTLGAERLLRPNTVYLLRLTNTAPDPQRVSAYLTWYEGFPDF